MSSALNSVVISGTGLWTPEHIVTNQELVASYNAWAARYNRLNAAATAYGGVVARSGLPLGPFRSGEPAGSCGWPGRMLC